MKVRVVYNPDKTIIVIHPAPKSKREGETEEEWLKRVFNKAMEGELKGLPYNDIDSSELPPREDRRFWRGEKPMTIWVDENKKQEYKQQKQEEKLIKKKIRTIAIKELKKEGKL